ncbi:MAG: hypothetical protein LBM93_01665 [Oscillospiraceae bacterium]|jgi:hypothetical protein|nr:hypothetical protein [Oscillospiraceae bacterium]
MNKKLKPVGVIIAICCTLSACSAKEFEKSEILTTENPVITEPLNVTEDIVNSNKNYFENIEFNHSSEQLNFPENSNMQNAEVLAVTEEKIYYYEFSTESEQIIYSYNISTGEIEIAKTMPKFSIYAPNSCIVGNQMITVTKSDGQRVLLATNTGNNNTVDIYNEEDNSGESYHFVSTVNENQFVEYWWDNDLPTVTYLRLGTISEIDGYAEINFTDINTENIQSSREKDVIFATRIYVNENKIYVMLANDISLNDLTLDVYDLEGSLLSTDNLDIVDEKMRDVENKQIDRFYIQDDFLFINYHMSNQLTVKLKDGISSEIVFDNLEIPRVSCSSDNKFVLFEREYLPEPNPETGMYEELYRLYCYDTSTDELTGLVETDMKWFVELEDKIVYCTPEGECFSVNLD